MGDKLNGSLVLFVHALLVTLGSPTLLCVIGSRMFFNLKEAAEDGVNVGTNWSSYSHSAIRFDETQFGELQSEYVTSTFYSFGG